MSNGNGGPRPQVRSELDNGEDLVVIITIEYRPKDGAYKLGIQPEHLVRRRDLLEAALTPFREQLMGMAVEERLSKMGAEAREKAEVAAAQEAIARGPKLER